MNPKWVDALFARFAVIWPKAWADVVGLAERAGGIEAMKREWLLGLAGLTGEQIKRAIEHHRNQSTWPPSIAEFRQAAKNGANAEQMAYQARAAEDALPALPTETRAAQLANGALEAQRLKADSGGRPVRSARNIARGLWTREMEDGYARSSGLLGIALSPIDWPDEVSADA